MYHRELIDELIIPCLIPNYSFIRLFNSMPESPALDIYINDEFIIARNIAYKGITPYFTVESGVYNIQIYLTGTKDNPIIELKQVQIYQDQILTLLLVGTANNIELVTAVDDINQTVNPDESMIRIFNLTRDYLTYSIGSIYSGLSSKTGTEYISISPGAYKLEINPPHRSHKISITVIINPGKIYTIYILESVPPDSPQYEFSNIYQILQVVDGNTLLKKCDLY
jgi:hypothetical protein